MIIEEKLDVPPDIALFFIMIFLQQQKIVSSHSSKVDSVHYSYQSSPLKLGLAYTFTLLKSLKISVCSLP